MNKRAKSTPAATDHPIVTAVDAAIHIEKKKEIDAIINAILL